MTKIIILATFLIIAFAAISFLIMENHRSKPAATKEFQGSWACIADTQECPDGTFVGRVPPYCHFAPCPVR